MRLPISTWRLSLLFAHSLSISATCRSRSVISRCRSICSARSQPFRIQPQARASNADNGNMWFAQACSTAVAVKKPENSSTGCCIGPGCRLTAVGIRKSSRSSRALTDTSSRSPSPAQSSSTRSQLNFRVERLIFLCMRQSEPRRPCRHLYRRSHTIEQASLRSLALSPSEGYAQPHDLVRRPHPVREP